MAQGNLEFGAWALVAFLRGGDKDDEDAELVGAMMVADGLHSLRIVRAWMESWAK